MSKTKILNLDTGAVKEFTIAVDSLADAAYIKFRDEKVVKTVEYDENVHVDVAKSGKVVGIEILSFSSIKHLGIYGKKIFREMSKNFKSQEIKETPSFLKKVEEGLEALATH